MNSNDLKNEILNMGAFDVGFFNDDFKGLKNGISFVCCSLFFKFQAFYLLPQVYIPV